MKLASIILLFDGEELLPFVIHSTESKVQLFIVIYQLRSNFGERYNPLLNIPEEYRNRKDFIWIKFTPTIWTGAFNEIKKRNMGLHIARENGCTHFFFQDTDEIWENFEGAVQSYNLMGSSGSVCRLWTFFKKPTWRLKKQEKYWVPFIHRLYPHTRAGSPGYIYYVDPTRSVPEQDVVELPNVVMHHMSWVRKDIERKIRNSSAKENIEKGNYLTDWNALQTDEQANGYYLKDFKDKLILVPNQFNIPAFGCESAN